MFVRSVNRVLLFSFVLIVALFVTASVHEAHAATCSQGFVAPALPVEGFGAPYSFASASREALLSVVNCTDTNVSVRAGNGRASTFIFPTGYVWRAGSWQQISFIPAGGRAGAWLTGSAFAVVPQGEDLSIVAYVCESTPQGFYCGCRGEGCAGNGRWTLQKLTEPAPRPTRQTRTREPASSTGGKWIMAYYPSWDRTRLEVADIDWSLMTHIAFGPVTPNSDGSINTGFDMREGEGARLAKDVSREAKRNGVVPILFVGGGAEGRGGWIGATRPENVDRFARALVATMDELGYDGIDIDWEPLLEEDHPGVERLARKLRELRPNMPMTLAVLHINGNQKNGHIDFFGSVHRLFDQINVMTYDMAGVWSGWDSWHHSALFGESSTRPSSIRQSMQRYVDGGVPKSKLGIGAPFYGYCIQGVTAPRQSFAGQGISHGAMSYRLIMRDYFNTRNYHYDTEAAASYLSFDRPTGAHSCQFITYMDERDAKERAEWARAQGYGGIIAWSLGQQHMDENRRADRHPLLKALKNGFLR
jgi:chitinase